MSSDQQVVPALPHRCYGPQAVIPHPPHVWYGPDWWNKHDASDPLVIGAWHCDGWVRSSSSRNLNSNSDDLVQQVDLGPFSDSPQLAAVRAAIEGLPTGTEGQVLTRAFSEAVAAAACQALLQREDARVAVGAEALDDLLCMLGIDGSERPEHGGRSTGETLAAAVIHAVDPFCRRDNVNV